LPIHQRKNRYGSYGYSDYEKIFFQPVLKHGIMIA